MTEKNKSKAQPNNFREFCFAFPLNISFCGRLHLEACSESGQNAFLLYMEEDPHLFFIKNVDTSVQFMYNYKCLQRDFIDPKQSEGG